MFLGSLIIGIVVAIIRGGRLRTLVDAPIRGFWWLLGAFLVPALLQILFKLGVPVEPVAPVLYDASLLALLGVLWINRRLGGIPLLGAGALLNALVIIVNGGRMPVSAAALRRIGADADVAALQSGAALTHQTTGPHIHLGLLADNWFLPWPRGLFSIGDLLISLGIIWLVLALMPPERGAHSRRSGA